MDNFLTLLSDLAIIVILLGLGGLLARTIVGPDQRLAYLSLGFPLGSGLLTWIVFLSAWIGIPRLSTSILIALSVLLLIALRFGSPLNIRKLQIQANKTIGGLRERSSISLMNVVFWSVLGIIVGSVLLISVGRSYSVWDSVAFWSLKGYGMAFDDSVYSALNWGDHGMTYPLNIPILISIFKIVGGDLLPGSKFIFPLYFLSLLIGSYRFWRKIGVGPVYSRIGILFLASVPIVFEFATVGYSNLPVGCLLTLSVLWGMEGVSQARKEFQLVSGILLGLVTWTRPEGIAFSLIGLIILVMIARVSKTGRVFYATLIPPVFVIGGSWLLFYTLNGGGESQAMGGVGAALASMLDGEFRLAALVVITKFSIKDILTFKSWGLLYPTSVIFVMVSVITHREKFNFFFWSCLVTSICFGIFTAMLFYVGQFQFDLEFLQGWLARGYSRAMIPSAILLAVMSISFFKEAERQSTA